MPNKSHILGALRKGSAQIPAAVHLPPPTVEDQVAASLGPAARDRYERDKATKSNKQIRDEARKEVELKEWMHYLERQTLVQKEIDDQLRSRVARSKRKTRGGTLLAQVTDVHFGGTVRRDNNEYDLTVAAKRLAAYAEEIMALAAGTGAEELIVCLTGDIFDSLIGKERGDKVRHSDGPAVWSFMIGRDLILQFIDELVLSEMFATVEVHGICGNEARLFAEQGFGEITVADNWDALLNGQISSYYAGSDVETSFSLNSHVIDRQGWRVLLMHGHTLGKGDFTQKGFAGILAPHSADFGMSGHIHDPYVSGKWSRSGSLIGTDPYAGEGLNLSGYCAQTCIHLLPQRRNTHVFDLQDIQGIEGYIIPDYSGAFGRIERDKYADV
jgi:hypothetical protein